MNDPVNHPPHYTAHPSKIECIQITEHMGFCLGNALKYIWRADLKGNAVEDLKKARWYIDREIARRSSEPCEDYYLLVTGDIIMQGDERLAGADCWKEVVPPFGQTYSTNTWVPMRRKIKKP